MIRVSKVSESFFPEIDFSFKNGGPSAALISGFTIRVLRARVDISPALDFRYEVNKDQSPVLSLITKNNGWGAAEDCRLLFSEPTLDLLFPAELRSLNCRIDSLMPIRLELDSRVVDTARFTRVRTQALEEARRQMEQQLPRFLDNNRHMTKSNGYEEGALEKHYLRHMEETRQRFESSWWHTSHRYQDSKLISEEIPCIPLQSPSVTWHCYDMHGKEHSGTNTLAHPFSDFSCNFYLTPRGFHYQANFVARCAHESDRTYFAMIDPERAPQERFYPISRQVPGAGLDRFHIRIGATKSSEVVLQFEFYVDGKKTIQSEPFSMRIWHPAGSRNHGFLDGDEILKESSDYFRKQENGTLNREDRWKSWEMKRQKEALRDFPFLPEDSRDSRLERQLGF